MKLVADPATERWLLGLTGADHDIHQARRPTATHQLSRHASKGESAL